MNSEKNNPRKKLSIKKKTIKLLKKSPKISKICFNIYNLIKKRHYKYFSHGNIVIDKYNTIFFPIPKVASSSLKKYFSFILGIQGDNSYKEKGHDYYQFRDFPHIKRKNVKEYEGYFKFTIVRNPYARIVSCYNNFIRKDKIRKNFELYEGMYPGMSFEEFVKIIKDIPDYVSDGHFRSQHTFLENKKGNLIVDFIGKMENIDKEFREICEKTGMPYKKLSHANKKTKENYKNYYNKETKRLVYERYKKDFELFNYEF